MSADAQKVRAVFLAAVENHTPSQWESYLDEACVGDPDCGSEWKCCCERINNPTACSTVLLQP